MLAVFILIGTAAPILAQERRADILRGKMVVDFGLVRPLGIVATVAGSAIFLASLPFSISGGNAGEVMQKLVVEPARFSFTRPLGKL
jgi:hypothetical protein